MKNSLGCGRKFSTSTSTGFICGVPDAWGQERLCPECTLKTKKIKNLVCLNKISKQPGGNK